MSPSPSPEILLIEDDPNDVFLIRRALRDTDPKWTLSTCRDGQEGISFLDARIKGTVSSPLPVFIITDLHLPKKDGHEVIEWIRSQPPLKEVPVVVLSSSSQRIDVDRALSKGANSFLEKPSDHDALKHLLRALLARWATHPTPTR